MRRIRFFYWVLRLSFMRVWEKIVHNCRSEFAVNGRTLTLVETAKYASGLLPVDRLK